MYQYKLYNTSSTRQCSFFLLLFTEECLTYIVVIFHHPDRQLWVSPERFILAIILVRALLLIATEVTHFAC